MVSGYLSGGLKVFYRIGLAIVKTHKRKMKASTSDADGVYAMLSAAVREQDTNVLIQTAFGIQLKSAQIDAAVRRSYLTSIGMECEGPRAAQLCDRVTSGGEADYYAFLGVSGVSLYDSTFSRTVWRLYGGAKGLVM